MLKHAKRGKPVAEVVMEANDALCEGNGANMFVTAWVGEIDLDSGRVSYVNAGHNPPLRLPVDGAPAYVRERSGLMLGAMPGRTYTAHELTLRPGEALYLYTDGITEQPDGNGELFGEERLAFSLRTLRDDGVALLDGGASPLLKAIFHAVVAHGGGVEQADDCTQIVVRYNGPVALPGNAGGV